jgi:hypothetical protein
MPFFVILSVLVIVIIVIALILYLNGKKSNGSYSSTDDSTFEQPVINVVDGRNIMLDEESSGENLTSLGDVKSKEMTEVTDTHKVARLLTSADVKSIMEARSVIPKEATGKSCYLVVESIEAETGFYDKNRQQIFEPKPPYKPMMKKKVFCNSNSGIEMQKPEVRNIMTRALKLENDQRFDEADGLFRDYLRQVRLSFSLLSKNTIYNSIAPGDKIIGQIDTYSTVKGKFLSVDSGSVRKSVK